MQRTLKIGLAFACQLYPARAAAPPARRQFYAAFRRLDALAFTGTKAKVVIHRSGWFHAVDGCNTA
jgi:hypothetical protein